MTVIKSICCNCVNASLFLSTVEGKYKCTFHDKHVRGSETCNDFGVGEQAKLKNRPLLRPTDES